MGNISSSNPIYNDIPMNEPAVLYSKELDYWDSRMSAFNDDVRRKIWLAYTIFRILSTLIIGFVFMAIVLNKKIRSKPYNLFLIFLMIPDLLYNIPGGVGYLMNYIKGTYTSVAACKMESFFTIFGMCANCWINALIGLELYRMLKESFIRKHYYPPSNRVVSIRCLLAYLYCAVIAAIGAISFEKMPFKTMLMFGGTACIPSPYDKSSMIFFNLVFSPLLIYIPFGIVTHVTVCITRRGYLPKRGEAKRVLTIFFFRLLLVYVLFWMPGGTLAVLSTNPSWAVVGGFLAQCNGPASAIAMLGKEDIMECVRNFTSFASFGLVQKISIRNSATLRTQGSKGPTELMRSEYNNSQKNIKISSSEHIMNEVSKNEERDPEKGCLNNDRNLI